MLPKYSRVCTPDVVDTGLRGPSPTRLSFSAFTRKSVYRILEGVTFTCVCNRLLPANELLVFWPRGSPSTADCVYSASNVSENHARPLTIGPENPNRGYQFPRW